mgnify:CR=1 FL=1
MSTTTISATPKKSNIRKLAEFIYDTGRGDQILAALDVLLTAGLADDLRAMRAKQAGGEET